MLLLQRLIRHQQQQVIRLTGKTLNEPQTHSSASKRFRRNRSNLISAILGCGVIHCSSVQATTSLWDTSTGAPDNKGTDTEVTEIDNPQRPSNSFYFLNTLQRLEKPPVLAQVAAPPDQLQGQVPMDPDPLESDLRDLGITDVTPIESVPNYQNNQFILETPDPSEASPAEASDGPEEAENSDSDETSDDATATVFDDELGNLRLRSPNAFEDSELGILRLQQIEELPREEAVTPPTYRTGFITGRTSFFGGTNLFRAPIPLDDRVFQGGTGFYLFPRITENTSLLVGAEGNLVRYNRFPNVSYNELQLQAGLRQRLTEKMSAQLSWRNQQLYALGGDNFFSADSAELLISRRDILGSKVWLDSYYQMRLSFSNPDTFSRFSQVAIASLNYGFTPRFRSSLIYQLFLDDYTQIERYDTYHQFIGQLSYDLTPSSRINLFGGAKFGRSSSPSVNFDDIVYGVSFNFSVPVF